MIKSRMMGWAGHEARVGEMRNAYNVLVEKPEVKRPLGNPWNRREGNIKTYLREIRWNDVDWIQLAQDVARWRFCEHGKGRRM
jgi:hypothetical protein